MLEEISKLLTPWPLANFVFISASLVVGIYAIIKGVNKNKEEPPVPRISIEDQRLQWKAYEHLENIENNSFKTVELLSRIHDRLNNNADQMKALSAAIWNRKEGF